MRGVNLDGDGQADLRVHGGPDKAVYAYAVEDYEWWADQLGRELEPGTFGENLTVRGLDLGATGDRDALARRHHRARGRATAPAVLQARDAHGRRRLRRRSSTRRRASVRTCASSRRATSAPATSIEVGPAPADAPTIREVGLGKVPRSG